MAQTSGPVERSGYLLYLRARHPGRITETTAVIGEDTDLLEGVRV